MFFFLNLYFDLTSPLRISYFLLKSNNQPDFCTLAGCPPSFILHSVTRNSQARSSSLLRVHLPPTDTSSPSCLSTCWKFDTLKKKHHINRLPQLRATPCVQSHPFKRSKLSRIWAFPLFARLPTYHASFGLLALCTTHLLRLPSDPVVTNNALANRIIFPPVGVMSAHADWVARHAGQTKKPG